MTLEQLIPFMSGNVIAIVMAYAWILERKRADTVQDRLDRVLLAFAGYRIEPDAQSVVKMDADARDATPRS